MKNLKLKEMILISMFAAFTAIGAFLKFNVGAIPFTLQFVFVAYAGLILGSKKGMYSQIVYVITGLVGFPIFAKGGGPTYIFQPSFGYLIGFIVAAYVIGKLSENIEEYSTKTVPRIFASVMAGLSVVYLIGASYLYFIFNVCLGKAIDVSTAIALGVTPFVPSDLILSSLVVLSSVKILNILKERKLLGL